MKYEKRKFMKRPALSAASFLKHLFAPKSNALPTGIRARKLVGTKGRNKGRLAAYNRMSGPSQEILRMSGLRDQYLKGEATLKDARSALRRQALKQGYAKPTKREKEEAAKIKSFNGHMDHVAWAASKVSHKLREEGKKPNHVNMIRNMAVLTDDTLTMVANMNVGEIRAYAGDDDNLIQLPDGRRINPLWYN